MAAGLRQRHGNRCTGKGRCNCPFEAAVFSKQDAKKAAPHVPDQSSGGRVA
jgi:hypothetical protein